MIFRREESNHEEEADRSSTDQSAPTAQPMQSNVTGQSQGEPTHPSASGASGQPSIVAPHTTWTGTLECNGSVEIQGKLNGEIIATGDVYIAQGAEVDAQIQAVNVTIAGQTDGTIACEHRFEVLESGVVEGRIHAPTLVIHDGATINGQLRMSGEPNFVDESIASDREA